MRVVGIALSPEFIYALGPGDLMPDDRRFAVIWMGQRAAEAAFDQDGAFNSLLVGLRHDAVEDEVIETVDLLLARFGGSGTYPRKDQLSHAFMDAELNQLKTMSRIVTPIFFAVAASLLSAWIGGLQALRKVVGLSPAVAMSPPAPPRYGRGFAAVTLFVSRLSQGANMVVRHTLRFPVRTGLTVLGIAASGALLIMSLSTNDATEFMIDVTFFQTNRQDITVTFADARPIRVAQDLRNLPGVVKVETYRDVAATLRHGPRKKRMSIQGLPPGRDLQKLLDREMRPIALPGAGVAISEKLAELLDIRRGQILTIEVTEGRRRTVELPVTAILQGYIGLQPYVTLDRLNRIAGDGRMVTSADLMVDNKALPALYSELKNMPAVAAIMLLRTSLKSFRKTLARNIDIMMQVFVTLAVIITFGVVYNSARIQLSERGRELASLRVLGFTRGEVALLTAVAIPLSWVLGYLFTWLLLSGFDTELYRVPFIIERNTYVFSSLIMCAAATVSAIIVGVRVARLDLIQVLKTRE